MDAIAEKFEVHALALRRYFKVNAAFVAFLSSLALAAYGFELFNLNLTIDDEIRAFLPDGRHYISHGRWGLFLLDKFLLPYPIIPFVPLFIALACHIGAILLLLECWGVERQLDRFLAGGLGVVFPGSAYFYMFSVSNYAIGIGLLCSALSFYLFSRLQGRVCFLAIIPAVIALSIYQAFAVVLASVYLTGILSSAVRGDGRAISIRKMADIAIVGFVAFTVYWLITAAFLSAAGLATAYVDELLSLQYLRDETQVTIVRTFAVVRAVYGGSGTVYAVSVQVFGAVMALALGGLFVGLLRVSLKPVQKLIVCLLVSLLMLLPFAVGLFVPWRIPVRFLVALPVVISGLTAFGLRAQSRNFRLLTTLCAAWCIFQFVVSINYLNSSSHLALQADRAMATQVISRIEDARVVAGLQDLKYIEVVGYRERPASLLMPKLDTFGASFFEWDLGNAIRMIYFLRTLGYYNGTEPMPAADRQQKFELANSMPAWPAPGSVRVDGNAAIIKFSEYSAFQKKSICEATGSSAFCENETRK